MAFAAPILPALGFGLAGVAVQALSKPKAKPTATAAPLPAATPRANSVLADALAARRGSAANQRTGAGGAESRTAPRKSLMGQ